MPVVAVAFIIVLLALALIYAWWAPEVSICVHCTYMIQRSDVDEERWFHCSSGLQACYSDAEDSPLATPDMQFDL